MKKFLILSVAAVSALSMTACSGTPNNINATRSRVDGLVNDTNRNGALGIYNDNGYYETAPGYTLRDGQSFYNYNSSYPYMYGAYDTDYGIAGNNSGGLITDGYISDGTLSGYGVAQNTLPTN